jgi:hypothetical protein
LCDRTMHVEDPKFRIGSVLIVSPPSAQVSMEHAEKLLLAAILRRAAYDIAYYRGSRNLKARRWWENAHRWMFGEDAFAEVRTSEETAMDEYMSFHNICFMLNEDPNRIRRKTLRLTKKDVRKYDMVDPYGRVH